MVPEAHELGRLVGGLYSTSLGAQKGTDLQRRFCRSEESGKMVRMCMELEKTRHSLAIEQVYDMAVYFRPYHGYGESRVQVLSLYHSILTYRHPFALWL